MAEHVRSRKLAFNKLERLENLISAINPETFTEGQIKTYLKLADESMHKIDDAHTKIIAAITEEADIMEQDELLQTMEEKYQGIMTALYDFQATSGAATRQKQHIKLPDFQLPSFDGKYEDWPSFADLFKAAIEKNSSLSPSVKLHYLKTCTKGEAHNLVKNFKSTDSNYKEAWQLLSKRYSNTREIVSSLVKKLINQQPIKTESIQSLQSLVNTTLESLRSLQVMGRPTEHWDDLVTFIVIDKLDPDTRAEWAKSLKGSEPPKFTELQEFLEQHIRTLHAKGTYKQAPSSRSTAPSNHTKQIHHSSTSTQQPHSSSCQHCKEPHPLYRCPNLIAMSADRKREAVKATRVCLNCLRDGHMAKDCSSNSTCRKCGGKHNTFVHMDQLTNKVNNKQVNTSQIQPSPSSSSSSASQQDGIKIHTSSAISSSKTILKTALVDVLDSNGTKRQVRVFLDDGADASLIQESTMTELGLSKQKTDVLIKGVGDVEALKSTWKTQVRIFSQINNSFIDVDLYAVPKVTGSFKAVSNRPITWSHIKDLKLADPYFQEGGEIHILLGTDTVPYTYLNGIQRRERTSPVAQNTIFGWVISGNVSSSSQSVINVNSVRCQISDVLRKFWEVEEVTEAQSLTMEEKQCEAHFMSTHRRDTDGRYIVRLPFNSKIGKLGLTRDQAFRRLLSLERRFLRQPAYKTAYISFMREYLELNHMEQVPADEISKKNSAYLPHHFVLKEDSTTTKQRTVFDGSALSSTGISLNDTLMAGATVQPDLFTLILRFRMKIIAIKADIAKMYRQFIVDKEDRDYQRIFWREESNQPVKEYRLTTVTYGTKPAPFLATRSLNQLAKDEGEKFPAAAEALLKHTYVDDFLGCESSKEKATELVQQLIKITSSAGMEIRKWCSSDPSVISFLPDQMKEDCNMFEFNDTDNDSVKALGIKWQPHSDTFMFNVQLSKAIIVTKRHILSEIAKTFDPIGWLSPVIITAKLLLQRVWLEGLEWDKPVSIALHEEWEKYLVNLQEVQQIRIPRCVVTNKVQQYEFHGFSDSSELAMASAVYLKCTYTDGSVSVNLIASKTKVAPVKAVSLPKLELSAAKLLAETVRAVYKALELDAIIFCWTDSTITLRWICSHSRRWKTYVANRVSSIQSLVPPERWRHVKGEENPADLPSRGISASQLRESQLWWHGPAWLLQDSYPDSQQQCNEEDIRKEEKSKQIAVFHLSKDSSHSALFSAFSSFLKLCRHSAYFIRIRNYLLSKKKTIVSHPLTPTEVRSARNFLIKWAQQVSFPVDLHRLQKGQPLPTSSKLNQLNPFIDKNGILRVGGRIQRAELPDYTRHPIILPHDHHITTLIINDAHMHNLHSGFTLTMATIRRQYWILRGRDVIRHNIRKCIICRKHRPVAIQQIMGNLPAGRVNSTKAFLHAGVDFAGPFNVKVKRGRYYAVEKSYFAIFICLATKAVHLEAVDNLTSEGFIASFERFISRRGSCTHLYSDNGTNFVGADNILKQFYQEQLSKVQQQFCNLGTQWHFNPPSAPHQGGLWEAGVKSVKFHFYRVVGQSTLVMDQFQTLLCKIEAILNSRPLCALSSDPTDLEALTPGHFLVGGPITSIPEPDVLHVEQNRLSHWELVRQMSQAFWKRWSTEYVTTLQQRHKWTQRRANLEVGDLVVIMDDQLPLTRWKIGRVIKTHPGADELVRTVTLKTAIGELMRPITKLSPLILQKEH